MGSCPEIISVKVAMTWLVQTFFTYQDHRYSMVWYDMKKVHWAFLKFFFFFLNVFRVYMIMEIVSMSVNGFLFTKA